MNYQQRVAERNMAKIKDHLWIQEFPGAITVCDSAGIILEMNSRAIQNFREEGGCELIGRSLFDCHPEDAKTKLKQLMETKQVNVYTTEKNGVRKLICQTPWYEAGQYRGFVEMSLVIPGEIPNLIRDP
jgi:transcriptional regulator with PAS, ATPase and Fis domain